MHARVLRRRFGRAVRAVTDGHRRGELSAAEAGTRLSRTLRSFLHQATGVPAQYLQLDELAETGLADAAELFAELEEARFAAAPGVDVASVGRKAEELVRACAWVGGPSRSSDCSASPPWSRRRGCCRWRGSTRNRCCWPTPAG